MMGDWTKKIKMPIAPGGLAWVIILYININRLPSLRVTIVKVAIHFVPRFLLNI